MTKEEYIHIAEDMRYRLEKLAASCLASQQQAEDVAQEALLRLWLLRNKVTAGDAEALLIRMVKNLSGSQWRHLKAHNNYAEQQRGRLFCDTAEPLADNDNQRLLQEAVRSLRPFEQRLFRMRHELDMDIAQIAAATGQKPRAISATISIARHKIMEQLKKGGIL
jgi:RNA polymerase sigma-70 factor (ECF subfamily)